MEHPDHRQLGRQLGIYATDEALGSGLPLWLPAGAAVRAALERYIVGEERRAGYQHVYSPELAKRQLYERSGHWEHYRNDMFPPIRVGSEDFVLRPMNCPHHILVYQAAPRTRREMPVRIAELATMYRDERSGVVGGLSRVRRMTLNDGHVFCPLSMVGDELVAILSMIARAFATLGLPPPAYRLSRRGPGAKFVDDAEMWESAERLLVAALDQVGAPYVDGVGEAAFYGPKIDVQVQDPMGREQTLSTVQVDFYLPGRFDLSYVDGGVNERPVMIHRSVVSTMERMVAHLLEVHNGALPFWLAPVQCVVLPVVSDAVLASSSLQQALVEAGVRVEVDDRDATLAARVRDAEVRKVPCVAVIGRREVQSRAVSVRGGPSGLELGRFVERLAAADAQRLAKVDL